MELAVFVIKTKEKTYLLYNDEAEIMYDKDSESEVSDEGNKVGPTTQTNKLQPKPSKAGHQKPRQESSSSSNSTPSNEEEKEEDQRGPKHAGPLGHSRRLPGATTKLISKGQKTTPLKQEGTTNEEQEAKNKKRIELEQKLHKYSQPLPKKYSTELINKTLNNVIEAMCGMRKELLENVLNKVGKNKEDIINEGNDKINIELIKLASLGTPFGEEMTRTLEKIHNTKH